MKIYDSIYDPERRFFLFRREDEDKILYPQKLEEKLEVLEHFGLDMFKESFCVKYEKNGTTKIQIGYLRRK